MMIRIRVIEEKENRGSDIEVKLILEVGIIRNE